MSDLSDLYQQAVLDHNNRPRNFGPLENAKWVGARVQPAVRGYNKRGGCAGRGDYQGGWVSGGWVRYLQGLGIDDDGAG